MVSAFSRRKGHRGSRLPFEFRGDCSGPQAKVSWSCSCCKAAIGRHADCQSRPQASTLGSQAREDLLHEFVSYFTHPFCVGSLPIWRHTALLMQNSTPCADQKVGRIQIFCYRSRQLRMFHLGKSNPDQKGCSSCFRCTVPGLFGKAPSSRYRAIPGDTSPILYSASPVFGFGDWRSCSPI